MIVGIWRMNGGFELEGKEGDGVVAEGTTMIRGSKTTWVMVYGDEGGRT